MKKNQEYSVGSKLFHWLIALLVISMLSVSFFLEDFPEVIRPTAIMWHKSIGITVLLLMLLRGLWIIQSGKPELPAAVPQWERFLSHFVQYSFYLLLILMPICGWVMSVSGGKVPSFFGLFNLPLPGIIPNKNLANWMFEAHRTIAWLIIGFLFLHIAGALKHHFFDKDSVLRRIWF